MNVRKIFLSDDANGGIWVMTEDGGIRHYETPAAAVHAIKRQDKAAAARGTSTTSILEWQGMPAGFTPPG